jgi:hypothetical protein
MFSGGRRLPDPGNGRAAARAVDESLRRLDDTMRRQRDLDRLGADLSRAMKRRTA